MNLATPDEGYFADGVVDDIIRGLAGLKELFVVSRGSSLGFGGRNIDVREIGRQLGVRYVLYGGVQRTMTTVRIVTELSDAESGEVIRSDLHEGDLGELFALQDRIAINVVRQIAPQVRERELMRAMRKHPPNLTAYELVLQALEMLYRMDYDSSQRPGACLSRPSHTIRILRWPILTLLSGTCFASVRLDRRTRTAMRSPAPDMPRKPSSEAVTMRSRWPYMATSSHLCSMTFRRQG